MSTRSLELLSPAANSDIGIEAVKHGADAVYIGPPSHGARKAASNTIEEIERLVDFAHQYRVKVYATVNTIVYDNEIKRVEELCRDLYHAGVDALIVQDMGILRMNIPPIALHASTQCDIRTPEKAKFLEDAGFSQLVLARELTISEIKAITDAVSVPVETFVHGALCVSYSGRCHASAAITGRSANRGECAQLCRLLYTLTDSQGKVIIGNRYLLSLKDFNASENLKDLIEAGVCSFKIEGRLKDASYVKNITAFYSEKLKAFISKNPDCYRRSSYGETDLKFVPRADKSFNRGFTNYFLETRKPLKIASLITPKSQGELIEDIKKINNGDGISFIDERGVFSGVNVNRREGTQLITARDVNIPYGSKIYRTYDVKWDKLMGSETSNRKIIVDITIDNNRISAKDERGVAVCLPMNLKFEEARKEMNYRGVFEKLGNTPYRLGELTVNIDPKRFYRASELTTLRRDLISLLDSSNRAIYPFEYRRKEKSESNYPSEKLDFRDNVSHSLAEQFYREHGIKEIERGVEVTKNFEDGMTVMTTRHCVLRELGLCKKEKGNTEKFRFPLYLNHQGGKFRLDFDCKNCEMKVLLSH